MADWTYGDAGDRYPMLRGEVWMIDATARGGQRHFLAVGDIEAGDWLRMMRRLDSSPLYAGELRRNDGSPVPKAFYSDPPWDKGNARSFRTKAFGKENSRPVDFLGSLLPRVVEAATSVSPLFIGIEMGIKHEDDLAKLLSRSRPAGLIQSHPITYYRTNPCRLVTVNLDGPSAPQLFYRCRDTDDTTTPTEFLSAIFDHRGPGIVYDCCAGQGQTPVSADESHFSSVSMELNPRRLACAVARLVDRTGQTPVLVDTFTKDD